MNARRIAIVVLTALTLGFVPAVAQAQLPVGPPVPVPELPEVPQVPIPAPVEDAIYTGLTLGLGPAYTAAIAAMPAFTAAGFLVRPVCGSLGELYIAEGLASGYVTVPAFVTLAIGPALIECYAASQAGPADPVMEQIDSTAGPQLSDIYATAINAVDSQVLNQVPGLVRAEISANACVVPALLGPVLTSIPAPANRIAPFGLICSF